MIYVHEKRLAREEQKRTGDAIHRDVSKIYSASGCYLYRRFKNEVRLSWRRRNVLGIKFRVIVEREILLALR